MKLVRSVVTRPLDKQPQQDVGQDVPQRQRLLRLHLLFRMLGLQHLRLLLLYAVQPVLQKE